VTILPRPFKALPHAPLVLAASLLAATLMLLVTVAVAGAETIDSVTAAATAAPAAEAPVPSEELQAAGEEAETQVDPAPPVPPAPVAKEPSETMETAPSVRESIDETVESSGPTQHVSELVENVRQGSAARVTDAADRLPGVRTDPVRDLVDHVARQAHHVVAEALPHMPTDLTAGPLLHSSPLPIRLLPEATSRPEAAHTPSPPLRSPSSPPQRATWLSPPQLIATPGAAEPGAAASMSLEHADDGGAAPSSAIGAGATSSHVDADRGGSPAPSDPPLPAPGSPGAVAPGSGGPIFIPFAALLALLALVAPAILRRLGEVPGFRPLSPFVCALERPG